MVFVLFCFVFVSFLLYAAHQMANIFTCMHETWNFLKENTIHTEIIIIKQEKKKNKSETKISNF